MQKINGAGGTSGGIGTFIIGAVMIVAGGFLFMNHVQVGQSFWYFFGRNTQGLMLIPLIAGIAFLFFNGKSIIGWVLTIGGALIIFLGVIVSLRFYFPQTSLYNLIIMLVLLLGGIGLVFRSLRTIA
jgi:hypothetical protein